MVGEHTLSPAAVNRGLACLPAGLPAAGLRPLNLPLKDASSSLTATAKYESLSPMKQFALILAAVMFLGSGLLAGEPTGTSATTNPTAPKKLSGIGGPQVAGKQLTDEEIASLKTQAVIDEKKDIQYQFVGSFAAVPVTDAKEKKKLAKSGKIPIRITCALYEVKGAKTPKPLAKRMSGSAQFYILDSEGKMVEKKTVSLDKMCPS